MFPFIVSAKSWILHCIQYKSWVVLLQKNEITQSKLCKSRCHLPCNCAYKISIWHWNSFTMFFSISLLNRGRVSSTSTNAFCCFKLQGVTKGIQKVKCWNYRHILTSNKFVTYLNSFTWQNKTKKDIAISQILRVKIFCLNKMEEISLSTRSHFESERLCCDQNANIKTWSFLSFLNYVMWSILTPCEIQLLLFTIKWVAIIFTFRSWSFRITL